MKKIILLFNMLLFVFYGCSGSERSGGEEVLAKFIREQPVTGGASIFHYEYSIGESEPKELKVYVKEGSQSVIINVGSEAGNIRNTFLYYPRKTTPNFYYELRDIQESAYSLREAVDKSVLYYLENF